MDALSDVRRNADFPHLPQTVENLPDVIGLGRNGDRLEQGELAHTTSAGHVKELVEGVDLFNVEISDQGGGRSLADTRSSRDADAFDSGNGGQ